MYGKSDIRKHQLHQHLIETPTKNANCHILALNKDHIS